MTAPVVVTPGGAISFTENATAVTIDGGITIADAEDTQLHGATITISTGSFVSGDILAVQAASLVGTSIIPSYNSVTGVLTLSGIDTLAHFQSVLQTASFVSTSEDPTSDGTRTTRTITWSVTDGGGGGNGPESGTDTSTVNLTALTDNPTVTAGSSVAYTENASGVTLESNLSLTDVDDAQIASATVTITAGSFVAGDVLAATATGSITVSYDGSGVLTLLGADSVANYQTVLRSVKFSSTSEDPTVNGTRTTRAINWSVTDANSDNAGTGTGSASSTVSLTPLTDNPVITPGTTASYTENASAVAITGSLLLTDADDTQMAFASATISAGTFVTSDVLAATTMGTSITAIYNGTGVLTLTGTDSVANYQTVLRSVTFSNPSEDPTVNNTRTSRSVSWSVTDANSDSAGSGTGTASAAVTVVAVNDNPVVTTSNGPVSYTENATAVVIDNGITVTDVDDTQIASASVSITSGLTTGDVLAATGNGTITASYTAGTGILTLSGTDTLANYEAVLRTVTYVSISEDPTATSTTRTITFSVTDTNSDNADAATGSATRTITITPLNDAPTAVVLSNTVTTTAENGGDVRVADIAITDDALGTNVLSLSGADAAAFSLVGNTLHFNGGANFEGQNSYSVTVDVDDAGVGGTPDASQSFTLTITDVNEAPTAVVTAGQSVSINENLSNASSVLTALATDCDVTATTFQNWTITGGNTSVDGDLNLPFAINASTGAITVNDSGDLNREQIASFSLTVTVSDGVNTSAAQTVVVNLNDLNDVTPVVTAGQSVSINENLSNTSSVLTVLATDGDVTATTFLNWTITAGNTSVDGDLNLPFAINASTGAITVNDVGDLNREQIASFSLTVTVSDGVNTSAAQTVVINLNDLNDVTPVVTAGQSVSIAEGSANGTTVLTVAATDGDVTATTFQNWTITGGNTSVDGDLNLPFAINASTGAITVNDSGDLNGSVVTSNLSVTVSDGVHTSVAQTVAVGVLTTAVSVSGGVLTITDTGMSSDQPVDMYLDSMGNLIIHDPNNVLGAGTGATQIDLHTISIPFASLTQLVVNGGGGNDTLTLDFAGGNPIPTGGLIFNGGTGGHDTLALIHVGGAFDTEVFNYANLHDGSIALISGGVTSNVTYTGLEPISIDGTPANIIFNLTSGNDTGVTLKDDTPGLLPGVMRLSGSTFETTDFAVGIATSITINGLGGNDAITVTHVDATYTGSLTINGGDGHDSIDSSAVNFAVTLLGGNGNDRLTSGGAADSLSGGAGNDTLKAGIGGDMLSGGSGNDVLNGEAGIDRLMEVVTGNAKITNTKLTSSSSGTDTLVSLEFADIFGDSGNNVLDASLFTLGSVTLRGMDGDDTLLGGRTMMCWMVETASTRSSRPPARPKR